MTKKDIAQLNKDMDEWWSKLNSVTKSHIYHFIKSAQEFEDAKKAIEDQNKKITKRFWRRQRAFKKQMEKVEKNERT